MLACHAGLAGVRQGAPETADIGGPSASTLPSTWLKMTHDEAVERLKDGVSAVRALRNPRIRMP